MRSAFVTAAVFAIVATAGPAFAQSAAQKGEKVYTDQKCSMCHSIAGKGNKSGPLDNVGTKLTAEQIREWITDPSSMEAKMKTTRKPAMSVMASKFKALPKDDVDALVAYLQTLKGK